MLYLCSLASIYTMYMHHERSDRHVLRKRKAISIKTTQTIQTTVASWTELQRRATQGDDTIGWVDCNAEARSGNRLRLMVSCWVLALTTGRALAFRGVFEDESYRTHLPFQVTVPTQALDRAHIKTIAWRNAEDRQMMGCADLKEVTATTTIAMTGYYYFLPFLEHNPHMHVDKIFPNGDALTKLSDDWFDGLMTL